MFFLLQLEEELKLNILKWETEQSSHFMINGQKPMIYIATQWEQHRFKKEQEKQERVRHRIWAASFHIAKLTVYIWFLII